MGKSTIIAILFADNSNNIFFSGQLVTGHVHVQTTEEIKMRGIRLKVKGKAFVRWSVGSGDDEEIYTGKEELFNMEIDLMGSRNKDSELHLQPGTYNLPFTCVLPPGLPSSYEHSIGHIRYKAKAVIDLPFRIDDTAEVALTVVHSFDLNREVCHLREPVVVQSHNPASGCCCVSGVPEIDIMLNKGLFIVGETILVQGEISNRTNTRISYSTIAFVQNTEFCATSGNGNIDRSRNDKKILASLKRPAIGQGCTDRWDNIAFVISPVLPSTLDGCRIINIAYYIEVIAVFKECCSDSSARADVIIGSVPLLSGAQPSVIASQPQPSMFPIGIPAGYPTSRNLSEKNFI